MPSENKPTLRDHLDKEAAEETSIPPFPAHWKTPSTPQRQQELHLWRKWKESGEKPEHMEPLLQSLQPLIHNRIQQFRGVPVQPEVLQAEANRQVLQGLRRFDPSKAQMHTYLTTQLKGMQRYVIQHQNLSRIIEDRANKIGDYQRAKSTLYETLSREPTAQEIADYMKVPVRTVTRLTSEIRPDLLASGALEDPFIEESPRSKEVLQLLPFELAPQEMLVFEYLTGYGGKTKNTSTGWIARKLGWSDSKVSQIRAAIANKIRAHL